MWGNLLSKISFTLSFSPHFRYSNNTGVNYKMNLFKVAYLVQLENLGEVANCWDIWI